MVQKLIDDLQPMYEEAEREGMWFFCPYQQLWFSPSELRQEQSEGRFRWAASNWKLRDPSERELQLVAEIASTQYALAAFRVRMARP